MTTTATLRSARISATSVVGRAAGAFVRAALWWLLACALVLCATKGSAVAQCLGLDLDCLLRERNTRVLVVDYFAHYCGPCKEALPKWRSLAGRNKHVKLVVVHTLKDECLASQCEGQRCEFWQPGDTCDEGERLATGQLVRILPVTVVYSWQGAEVHRGNDFRAARRKVDEVLDRNPTVKVIARGLDGRPSKHLRGLVLGALGRWGKIDVKPTEEAAKENDDALAESFERQYDKTKRCVPGIKVPRNATLQVYLSADGGQTNVNLELSGASKQICDGAASEPWKAGDRAGSMRRAVDRLMDRLITPPQSAGTGPRIPGLGVRQSVVTFESEPPGAAVILDGELLPKQTPFSYELSHGPHRVQMWLTEHVTQRGVIEVTGKRTVEWTLPPNYGLVTIESEPERLALRVDGKPRGNATLSDLRLPPGTHFVDAADQRCYLPKPQQLEVRRGEELTVTYKPAVRTAGLHVRALGPNDEPLACEALIDGEEIGETPVRAAVPLCAQKLEVRCDGYREWEDELELEEGKLRAVVAEMRTGDGWYDRHAAPGWSVRIEFMRFIVPVWNQPNQRFRFFYPGAYVGGWVYEYIEVGLFLRGGVLTDKQTTEMGSLFAFGGGAILHGTVAGAFAMELGLDVGAAWHSRLCAERSAEKCVDLRNDAIDFYAAITPGFGWAMTGNLRWTIFVAIEYIRDLGLFVTPGFGATLNFE